MKPALLSLLLGLLLCTGRSAIAAPEEAAPTRSSDPVLRFLQERALVDLTAASNRTSNLLGSVRDGASELVLTAMNFLGVPYRFGGTSVETGFDCSGFTRHVFENSLGLILPRRAEEQANASGMVKIAQDELKPGDLVFFNTMRRAFSHVGIYVGDGKFIHSPRTGSNVRVEDMRQSYWTARFNGARRVPDGVATSRLLPGLTSSPTPPAATSAVGISSAP